MELAGVSWYYKIWGCYRIQIWIVMKYYCVIYLFEYTDKLVHRQQNQQQSIHRQENQQQLIHKQQWKTRLVKQNQQQLVDKQQPQNPIQINSAVNINDIHTTQQLKQCENQIHIKNYGDLDKNKKQIKYYQQSNKQYEIVVDFMYCSLSNVKSKIGVLGMISTLNADRNVGKLAITLDSKHKWNRDIITSIVNNYTNVYAIGVWDQNSQVDGQIHNLIQKYIQQQPITVFKLHLYGSIGYNHDGYDLVKQYNQLIKQKQCLEGLGYYYNRIGGTNIATTKQKIEELIDEIDKS